MPLSRDDLEAIRSIVREELAIALAGYRRPVAAGTELSGAAASDEMGELGATHIRALRGEPGEMEGHDRADARYRVRRIKSDERRARRTIGGAGPVSEDEMPKATKIWEAGREARRKEREAEAGIKAPIEIADSTIVPMRIVIAKRSRTPKREPER